MSRRDELEALAKDAVEASRKALGYGLELSALGAESKATIARLAAALIMRQQ